MKASGKSSLFRFLPYYKPHLPMLALDMFCSAFLVLCDVVLPLIVGRITDMAVSDLTSLTGGYITRVALFYLTLRLLDVGANFFVSSYGHIIGVKMETAMSVMRPTMSGRTTSQRTRKAEQNMSRASIGRCGL